MMKIMHILEHGSTPKNPSSKMNQSHLPSFLKRSALLLGFVPLLFSTQIFAQDLAVVYDKDGYTNVRKSASATAPIIGKIKEGQVFCISPFDDDLKSKDWYSVWFPIKPQPDVKGYIRSDKTHQGGFVHKSRVTFLSDLPELDSETMTNETNVFRNDEIEIVVAVESYKSADNSQPRNHLKSITLKTNAGFYQFPKSAINKLYEINLDQTKVYIGKELEVYIVTSNGDGSDSYKAMWCIKNNKLFSMTVMQTIP